MSAIFPPDNVDSSIYTSNVRSTFSIEGNTNAYSWISFLSVRFPPKALNLIILTTLLDSYIFYIIARMTNLNLTCWLTTGRYVYAKCWGQDFMIFYDFMKHVMISYLALGSGPLGLSQELVYTSEICKQNACHIVKIFPIDVFNILYNQKIKKLS